MGGESTARRRTWLVWAAVLLPYGFFVARYNRVVDDAYIAFRYSRHLAQGLGLTWNPGVDPPVEGFSSPLWVIGLAPFERLGWDVTVVARVISIACGASLLWFLARLAVEGLRLSTPAALAGVLWTAVMPPFAAWSTGGLETMAFALLIFLAYERLLARERPKGVEAGLLGVATFACRFDGIGWSIATMGVALALGWHRRDAVRVRAALAALGVLALGCAAIEVARIAYFGDPLPNTVYAKVAPGAEHVGRGLHYVARFTAVFPMAAAVFAIGLWRARSRSSPAVLGALALTGATFAYAIAVGGDFMFLFRFLAPAVPFLGLLLATTLESWRTAPRARPIWAGALAALVMLDALLPSFGVEPGRRLARRVFATERAQSEPESQIELIRRSIVSTEEWVALGRALAVHTPPESSLIRPAIGAVGYYSGRTIFDPYGLVDRDLARRSGAEFESPVRHIGGHDKYGNFAFFEPRQPDYGYVHLVHRSQVDHEDPWLVHPIFRHAGDEAFRSVYRPVLVPLSDYRDGQWYLLLAERDPAPDGTDARWRGPLLVPENLRAPSAARASEVER